MNSLLRYHLIQSYGRTLSVWIGMIGTFLACLILKGLVALIVARIIITVLHDPKSATSLIILLFGCLIAANIFNSFADYIFNKGADKRYKYLVENFHSSLMEKGLGFFRTEKVGALNALFRDHLDGTINVFRVFRVDVIPTLVSIFLPAIILLAYDIKVGLLVLSISIIQIWISIKASQYVTPIRKKALVVYRELSGIVADQIIHLPIIKASGRSHDLRKKVVDLAEKEAGLFWQRHRSVILFDFLKSIVSAICFSCVFWLLTIEYNDSIRFSEMAIVSAMYIFQSMNSANSFSEIVQRISEHLVKVSSSLNILNSVQKKIVWPSSMSHTEELDGAIQFQNVNFEYTDNITSKNICTVFNNLNVTIPAGMHIALVGPSGVGKSTFGHLLLRFEEFSSGAISIGGFNIKNIPETTLYKTVSYVSQQPSLLNDSIKANLTFYSPNASPSEISRVCEIVCLNDVIEKLEGGLDFQVGELGSKLSGGQRQRVALARALLRDASIYLLDEVTSALDHETAQQIIFNIRKFLIGKTVILITHSSKFAENFDSIFTLPAKD